MICCFSSFLQYVMKLIIEPEIYIHLKGILQFLMEDKDNSNKMAIFLQNNR